MDLYVNRPLALNYPQCLSEIRDDQAIVEIPDVDAVGFADDWGTQKAL